MNREQSFLDRKELELQRLDNPTNTVVYSAWQAVFDSYLVAWRIAQIKKLYIGEELVKPAALRMVWTQNCEQNCVQTKLN